jgi:hypothetical protein
LKHSDVHGAASTARLAGFGLAFMLIVLTGMLFLGACDPISVNIGPIQIGGTPVPPTNTVPPPTATPTPRALTGQVTDKYSGKPITGAEVTAGGVLTATNAEGRFYFDDVPRGATLSVMAEGYAPVSADTGIMERLDVQLRPNTLSGRVTDAGTGKPLEGVLVKLVLPGTQTSAQSPTPPAQSPTAPTTPTAGSMQPMSGPRLAAPPAGPPAQADTPTSAVEGSTTPAPTTATPTPTATPTRVPPTGPGFVATYTNADGYYFFKDVPEGASLTFKMPGYKLTRMPVGDTNRKDVALEVFKVEAIYITANVAAYPEMFNELIDFVDKSRLNAVVINVQNDQSEWVFNVKNPDVLAAKNVDPILPNMPALVKSLKDRGIYTIARIVTFQQKTMADNKPEWAVKSSVTGKPWMGGELNQQRWLDASLPAVQDHMVDMTREVLALGFDEVQYDYVRFPSDSAPAEPGDPVFSRPLTDIDRATALQQFLRKAHDVIEPTDAFMSIDVFGYSLWPDQNGKPILGNIGQVLDYLYDYTDYICPMIYPSHFSPGEQGCAKPAACAYELVHKAGEFAMKRFAGRKVKYRPWLQDFDWYGVDYTSPGTTRVTDQIRAAEETGAWGWQMWDPANVYEPRSAYYK